MNRLSKCVLSIFCLCIPLADLKAGTATKTVIEGQTVEETVLVPRESGILIEFPEEVRRAILGDKSLFACEQSGTDIVCAARGRESSRANLTVLTRRNRYFLTLISRATAPHNAVIFRYGDTFTPVAPKPANACARDMLKKFDVRKIDRKNQDKDLAFEISQIVFLGPRLFLFFSARNTGEQPFRIASLETEILTRAYLTGLPVQTSRVGGIIMEMDKTEIQQGEKINGIAVLPQIDMSSSQELSFVLTKEGNQNEGVKIENIRF